jgi:hypothetical protein
MLTQARLKELLHYNPETGIFYKNNVEFGCNDKDGYLLIWVDGKTYRAHRLAFLYVSGEIPKNTVDHINQIKQDNSFINLRLATISENKQNMTKPVVGNTSGYLGVSFCNTYKKFVAGIKVNGKRKQLGYFDTAIEASECYIKAKRKMHKFCTI